MQQIKTPRSAIDMHAEARARPTERQAGSTHTHVLEQRLIAPSSVLVGDVSEAAHQLVGPGEHHDVVRRDLLHLVHGVVIHHPALEPFHDGVILRAHDIDG